MIGAFVVYALILSTLIGLLAVAAERAAIMLRRPVRGLWVTAMAAMTLAPGIVGWSASARTPRISESASPTPVRSGFHIVAPPREETSGVALSAAAEPPHGDRPDLGAIWERIELAAAPLDSWLGIAWGMLSLALGVYAVLAIRATYRLPVTMPVQTIGQTVVHVSDAIGPAAIGGPNPSIVLPRWVLDLDASLLDLIIMHEQEHLRARDPRLLTLGLMWLILMPWHLPLWWAWRRLRLAIELDCDERVLRGMSSPRVYAQLLLFIGQQGRSSQPRSVLQQLSLAVPLALQTQGHHLKRRISAMTTRSRERPVQLAAVVAAVVLTGTLAFAIPAPRLKSGMATTPVRPVSARVMSPLGRGEAPAVVRVTHLGLILADVQNAAGPALEIVIYGEGPVEVGIGTDAPTALRDTIRLDHLPAFTADVTNGAVHIELRKAGGSMELGGDASGAPMTTFTVRGRHVVLDKGGTGVRGVPAVGSEANRDRTPPQSRSNSVGAAAARDDDLRMADSIALRVARLEMSRAKLLTNLSADAQPIRETDAELNALKRVAGTLSEAARARLNGGVTRLLAERRDGLRLELEQLLTKYNETSPMVVDIAKERTLVESRLAELRANATTESSFRH